MDRLVLIKSDRTPAEMRRMADMGAQARSPYWHAKAIKSGDKIHEAQPHERYHEQIISRVAHQLGHEKTDVGYIGHDKEFYPERFMHHAVMHHERQNGQPRQNDKVIFANHTLRQARHSLTAEHAARQQAGVQRRAEGMAKFKELMRSLRKALAHFFRAPAIKVDDHVYEGHPGEHHGDIYGRLPEHHKRSHNLDDGFVGHDNKYYTRAVATEINRTKGGVHTAHDPYLAPRAATSEALEHEQRTKPDAKIKKMPKRLRSLGEKPTVLVKSVTRVARDVDLVLKSDGPVKYTEHFQGIPISIESPAGSERKWYDAHTGKYGSNKMLWAYGYFQRTTASDSDSVDCFVGSHKDAPYAYIIRQMKEPEFIHYDEDKVMLGARSPEEAKRIYLAHYDDPRYFGRMDIVPMNKLREKLAENRKQPGPLRWGPSVEQHPTMGGTQE